MYLLLQMVVFHCYVSLLEGSVSVFIVLLLVNMLWFWHWHGSSWSNLSKITPETSGTRLHEKDVGQIFVHNDYDSSIYAFWIPFHMGILTDQPKPFVDIGCTSSYFIRHFFLLAEDCPVFDFPKKDEGVKNHGSYVVTFPVRFPFWMVSHLRCTC